MLTLIPGIDVGVNVGFSADLMRTLQQQLSPPPPISLSRGKEVLEVPDDRRLEVLRLVL